MEEDIGLSVGAARITGQDRSMWRTLRSSAGQEKAVSEWVSIIIYCDLYQAVRRWKQSSRASQPSQQILISIGLAFKTNILN